jgi:cytochrome c553
MLLQSLLRSRLFWTVAGLLLVAFITLQFARPKLTHPPVVADLQAPPDVKAILVTACYNCHSNETKLSWFDQIVPGYWLVVSDVNRARAHLNFSELGGKSQKIQRATLFEAINQVQLGAMPPAQYKLLHHDSILTSSQLTTLRNYLQTFESLKPSDAAQIKEADGQYTRWIQLGSQPAPAVSPTLSGFTFPPDYKNWKPLSTTDREDNHTLRVILGNDVAIKAVRDKQVNPWPDGTMFAKIAWDQKVDPNGQTRTGAFEQVEFMQKHSRKYASTLGWGWGRWLGPELKPYGKDSSYATSCVACHTPLHDSDFVFTMPVRTEP